MTKLKMTKEKNKTVKKAEVKVSENIKLRSGDIVILKDEKECIRYTVLAIAKENAILKNKSLEESLHPISNLELVPPLERGKVYLFMPRDIVHNLDVFGLWEVTDMCDRKFALGGSTTSYELNMFLYIMPIESKNLI